MLNVKQQFAQVRASLSPSERFVDRFAPLASQCAADEKLHRRLRLLTFQERRRGHTDGDVADFQVVVDRESDHHAVHGLAGMANAFVGRLVRVRFRVEELRLDAPQAVFTEVAFILYSTSRV